MDKLVTSAHYPPVEGSRGYCSTTTFPDLSHTMLSTNFCQPQTVAITPKGEMTKVFRQQAFRLYQGCERGAAEIKTKPRFFKRASYVFNNKVLLDLEQMKLTRNERRQKIWESGKKQHGFDSLDSSQESIDGIRLERDQKPRTLGLSHSFGGTESASIDATRPATSTGKLGSASYSSFLLLPSDGKLGGELNTLEGGEQDGFLVDDQFDPNKWDAEYCHENDAFESEGDIGINICTPALQAAVPAGLGVTERPATSRQLDVGNESGVGPRRSERPMHSPSTAGRDARIGMDTRLTAANNELIAEEERNFKPRHQDILDVAFAAVRKGSVALRESELKLYQGSKHAAPDNVSASAVLTGKEQDASRGVLGVSVAPGHLAVNSLRGSTSAHSGGKHSQSRNQVKGLTPARTRAAFSRETYFQCLFDTVDIPEPHAPRFGMLQSPHKSFMEKQEQRRAQTAAFEPRSRGGVSSMSPISLPGSAQLDATAPLSTSPIKTSGGSTSFSTAAAAQEPPLGLAEGEASPGSPAQCSVPRKLSKGQLRSVLSRMGSSRGGERGLAATGPVKKESTLSTELLSNIVPTSLEKWRAGAILKALVGDKYGEFKARDYR